jgi:dTDP-4-dehydrorhamnose reductase
MVATTRRELELSRPIPVGRMLDQHRPWAVIHAAGFSRPALAERYPLACFRDNVQAAAVLASECHRRGLPLLCFSSDQVFADGIAGESDLPRPVGLLARSLHERELAVLAAHPGALLVRTSAVFSAGDDTCFPMAVLRALRRGTEVEIPCQGNVSPTSLVDLVDACLDLLLDGASGVWHLTNQSSLPWTEWAQQVARAAGYAAVRIRPASASPWAVLVSERGPMLPSLGHALNHFMDESRQLRDAQRLNA